MICVKLNLVIYQMIFKSYVFQKVDEKYTSVVTVTYAESGFERNMCSIHKQARKLRNKPMFWGIYV